MQPTAGRLWCPRARLWTASFAAGATGYRIGTSPRTGSHTGIERGARHLVRRSDGYSHRRVLSPGRKSGKSFSRRELASDTAVRYDPAAAACQLDADGFSYHRPGTSAPSCLPRAAQSGGKRGPDPLAADDCDPLARCREIVSSGHAHHKSMTVFAGIVSVCLGFFPKVIRR